MMHTIDAEVEDTLSLQAVTESHLPRYFKSTERSDGRRNLTSSELITLGRLIPACGVALSIRNFSETLGLSLLCALVLLDIFDGIHARRRSQDDYRRRSLDAFIDRTAVYLAFTFYILTFGLTSTIVVAITFLLIRDLTQLGCATALWSLANVGIFGGPAQKSVGLLTAAFGITVFALPEFSFVAVVALALASSVSTVAYCDATWTYLHRTELKAKRLADNSIAYETAP